MGIILCWDGETVMIEFSNSTGYFPHQPSFETKLMNYTEMSSASVQHPVGAQYYSFYLGAANKDTMMIFPDGCIDVIICCNKDNPSANICGSIITERQGVFRHGECDIFAVRFFPGYGRRFLKYPACEFTEQEIPLSDVIPNSALLLEQIAAEDSLYGRINVFERFYQQFSRPEIETPDWVKYITGQIISSHGARSMTDLSQDIGYSSRYISKLFNEYVGMPPKLFSRIVRFQHVLAALMQERYDGIVEEMMELGYYDQNHFIKEFKKFSSFTPKKYMEHLAR